MPLRVIVTADDFGFDAGRTLAITRSLCERWVTHASLMVNLPGTEEACALVHAHRLADRVGLHLNLTSGVPLTDAMRRSARFCADGEFVLRRWIRYVPLLPAEIRTVAGETRAQIDAARRLGLALTHLDSHHHIHTAPSLGAVVQKTAKAAGIARVRPLRNCGPDRGRIRAARSVLFNKRLADRGLRGVEYFGSFEDVLWLATEHGGLTGMSAELMVHPILGAHDEVLDEPDGQSLPAQMLTLRRALGAVVDEEGRLDLSCT
jgi:predicted glycoside hydrolase/deacetylase ChbG (UPF0249 family)